MKISNETKVGALTVLAITLLILGFNFLKGRSLFKTGTFIYAKFSSTKGLMTSNPVFINGYQVGNVYSIDQANKNLDTLIVAIKMTKEVNIPNNSLAAIKDNPLGSPSLEIALGTNKVYLNNHDTLGTVDMPGMFGQVTNQLTPLIEVVKVTVTTLDSVMRNINSVFDPYTKNNLQDVVANFDQTTKSLVSASASLEKLLNTQTGSLSRSLDNMNTFTGNLANSNGKINATLTNLETTTGNLSRADIEGTLNQLKSTIQQLNTTVAKIDSKDGSLGLLLNDKKLYQNLESTSRSLNVLMDDVRVNPKRYVNVSFSVFGRKKSNDEFLLTPLPVVDTATIKK
jgi:phospholipid/cholesterol/gamma-HCH transport system substrate-binding protein